MNIIFLVFNRPECTAKVFERIAAARPENLLLVADGPRTGLSNDAGRVALVRDIISKVDWPCTVYCNFSEQNLGCRARVSSGLDWAFGIVEDAIILEDDCVPDVSFFEFCQTLLDQHRFDPRVMHIGGVNFQRKIQHTADSYYYSKYQHVWGWATWRRAWRFYDLGMTQWRNLKSSGWLKTICPDKIELEYWTDIFDRAYKGEINTWDYQWNFACWTQGGVAVVPLVNLVENIGFGLDATHTTGVMEPGKALVAGSLFGDVKHPAEIKVNRRADRYTFRHVYFPQPDFSVRLKATLFNKHYYGRLLRKIPIFGGLWARWRMT